LQEIKFCSNSKRTSKLKDTSVVMEAQINQTADQTISVEDCMHVKGIPKEIYPHLNGNVTKRSYEYDGLRRLLMKNFTQKYKP